MQPLENREEQEGTPSAPPAHSAVHFKHELNPGAKEKPEKDTGGPAVNKALPRIRRARERDQQRRERKRGEPADVKLRENQQQQNCR